MPNKAKTPSAPTPEVQSLIPQQRGIKSMKNDTSLINKNQLTMSSREIASLTNKRHDNVCRDIRAILVALLGGEDSDYARNSNLSYLTNQHVRCNQYDSKNPNAWEYHISRRYTEILITGYDIKRRTAVIDRLYELEEARILATGKKQIVLPKHTGLVEYRKARAIELSVRALDKMFSNLPHLSEQSKQAIYADTINPIAGKNVIPLPRLENKTFSAGEVGEQLGVSSNKIGRIANKLNLKTAEYGVFVLDKSRSSDKQVETFRYNEKAIDAIKTHLINKETA